MSAAIDSYVISNAAVFIDDGIADITTFANPEFWKSFLLRVSHVFNGLIIVCSHDVTAHYRSAETNPASYTDHAVFNTACLYNTTLCNDGLLECGTADFCRW